jgi:hypothetical protein
MTKLIERKKLYTKERICEDCGKIDVIRKDSKSLICLSCSNRKNGAKGSVVKKLNAHQCTCDNCKITFFRSKSDCKGDHNFCSLDCKKKFISIQRTCKQCDSTFSVYQSILSEKTNSTGEFCSKLCHNEYKKTLCGENNPQYKRIEVNCYYCKKEIKIIQAKYKLYQSHFCSTICRQKFHIGKYSGEKNHNWQGGHIQRKGDFSTVKRLHFSGINFCAVCGTFKKIHIHHIVPFRYTKDNSLSNLIPLCASCHRKIEAITFKTIAIAGIEKIKLIMGTQLRERQMITYKILKELHLKALHTMESI